MSMKPLFQKSNLSRRLTLFSSYPYDPDRDRILVDENRFVRKRSAVRYAISFNVYHVPNGTSEATGYVFYQHPVPYGTKSNNSNKFNVYNNQLIYK